MLPTIFLNKIAHGRWIFKNYGQLTKVGELNTLSQKPHIIWALNKKDKDKFRSMDKNYATTGPPRITSTPSKLSLYLATIIYNCLESY
jgi:hypothetical protein